MSAYCHGIRREGKCNHIGRLSGGVFTGRRTRISSPALRVVTCLALLAVLSGPVQGSVITSWTGSADSLWTQGANWDNGVPTLGYLAQIENVANNPVILMIPSSIDGLTIGALNWLTLQGAVLQTGALTNAGTITLASGTLTLQGAGPFTTSGLIQNATGSLGQLGGSVTNTGTIEVSNNSGLQFTGGSTYTNDGLITLNAAGFGVSDLRLYGGGTVILGGTGALTMTNATGNQIFADSAGMSLVNGAAHTITGAGVIGGPGAAFTLQNEGTITASGSAGMVFGSTVAFQNNGTLAVNAGSQANITGSFGNFTGQTLTGGTYDVAGVLRFTGADIVTNAADVTLDGPGATVIDQASSNALRNLSTNSGSLAIANGASLPALGNLTNTGTVNVGSGTTLTTTGYHQTAGSTLVHGTLVAPTFMLDGGMLGGRGTIDGSIITGGYATVAPGSSPGLLTIDGDYTQDALSLLRMELGGLIRGDEYSVLEVTGTMNLAGTLDVTLYGSFQPLAGHSFDLLDWGDLNGTFDTVHLPTLAAGLLWDASRLYTSGVLSVYTQVIPAPGAAMLVLLGLATMTGWRGKQRNPTAGGTRRPCLQADA